MDFRNLMSTSKFKSLLKFKSQNKKSQSQNQEPDLNSISEFLSPILLSNDSITDPASEWHRKHPRYEFIKSQEGILLDIGCGEGGLANYLRWPETISELQLHGCDLDQKLQAPKGYAYYTGGGYEELGDLKKFNAITAIHLIEHLPNLKEFFTFLSGARAGTQIYLEWPSLESCHFPTSQVISKAHPQGSLIATSNYFDDDTHLPPQR